MNVLVTGGAGYVGSLVVRQLLDQGHAVRVLDSLLYGDRAICDLAGHPGFELAVGDARDKTTVAAALSDISVVIHLAAIVGDSAAALDEERAVSTNVEATAVIAGQCRARDIDRLVFASSCSVYGASLQPLDETSDLNPVSLYADTKIAAERLLLELQSDAFAPVVLRFGTAYGAAPRFRFDLVVNLLTAAAVQDGQLTVHGGAQWRPFVHVYDIARAVVLAVNTDRSAITGEIINVGADEENYQLRQVADIIQRFVPSAEVITDHSVTDSRNYYVRFAKARELLGFTPTRTLSEGVRELIEAMQCGKVGDYRNPAYHNVAALESHGRVETRFAVT